MEVARRSGRWMSMCISYDILTAMSAPNWAAQVPRRPHRYGARRLGVEGAAWLPSGNL
jgi:hypothetical protein